MVMRLFNVIILFLCGFLASVNAFALQCHLNTANGITEETVSIGQVAVPSSLPVGSRLWTSQRMVRDVVCWGEGISEWVYFYGNPDNGVLQNGVGLGIIYNGVDMGLVHRGSKLKTDIYVSQNETRGHVEYQVYLQKVGPITGGVTPWKDVAIFQLDGEGGINSTLGKNYRFILTDMDRIYTTDCSVSVMAPDYIDFGTVSSESVAGGMLASKVFTIEAKKNKSCSASERLAVDIILSPINGALENNDTSLNMGNNSVLRFEDDGNLIRFDSPVSLWRDISTGYEHAKLFNALLISKGVVQTGYAERSIIIHVNYK